MKNNWKRKKKGKSRKTTILKGRTFKMMMVLQQSKKVEEKLSLSNTMEEEVAIRDQAVDTIEVETGVDEEVEDVAEVMFQGTKRRQKKKRGSMEDSIEAEERKDMSDLIVLTSFLHA